MRGVLNVTTMSLAVPIVIGTINGTELVSLNVKDVPVDPMMFKVSFLLKILFILGYVLTRLSFMLTSA